MSLPAQSSAVAVLVRLRRTEQERDAPDSGEGDERVDYTRYHRALTAAYPRDDVEAEQTDASPVERADNGEHKGDLIHNHIIFSPRNNCAKRRFGGALLIIFSNLRFNI